MEVVEGEAVFRANHVILCEAEDFNKRHIFALCLQTSALKSSPDEVKFKLGPEAVLLNSGFAFVPAKAGQSEYCKHVVAVPLYVDRNQELNALSCTDVKQVWGEENRKIGIVYSSERAVDYWNIIYNLLPGVKSSLVK